MTPASVVIPTYNAESFVAETIESVLTQTVLPGEIVVVDDCSTDDTRKLLRQLAKNSPVEIRVIKTRKNSGGPSRPYNVGIEAARNELVLLLDQDDVMYPRRVELQTITLESCPQCVMAIGRFSIMDRDPDDLTPMWTVPQFDGFESLLDQTALYSVLETEVAFPPLLKRNYSGSASNFGFFKHQWKRVGGFDERAAICNDLDAMLRATAAGPIAIINEKLFKYRWSPKSLFRRDITRSLLDATMVRLRAASVEPGLAGEELEALRYTAMMLGQATLRKGDFTGFHAMVETMIRHRGALVLKKTMSNKARRLKRS